MIRIKRHTEGDSRVAVCPPTISEFDEANIDHIKDVQNLADLCCTYLKGTVSRHDWTKVEDPYRTMFYKDLCATIEGKMEFMDGEWARLHYEELERHHLKRHCPEDVNLFDVIEMICDCTAAGMARSGEIYDIDIPADILTKAIKNTVEILKNHIEVVE